MLARRAVEGGRQLVVAAGGDGTVADVAAGLVGSSARLGILPLGSVMNLARMLGIPRDLEAAIDVLTSGRSVTIDVGRASTAVGERYFLEAAGVGASAALLVYGTQLDRRNWRSLRSLFGYLRRYRPHRLRVVVDGRPQEMRATMVTIANGPLLGPALTVTPDARLDDRLLTVHIYRGWRARDLLPQLWAIVRGRVAEQRDILACSGRVVEIESRRPLMVHADIHPLGTTPARFELLPAALRAVVPASSSGSPPLGLGTAQGGAPGAH